MRDFLKSRTFPIQENNPSREKALMEKEWFQIALKTYFWFGVMFSFVSATGLASLAGSVYFYNRAREVSNEVMRDFRAIQWETDKARESVRKTREYMEATARLINTPQEGRTP
jgi:hypothetical protein